MQEWHKQAQISSDQDSSTELVKPTLYQHSAFF